MARSSWQEQVPVKLFTRQPAQTVTNPVISTPSVPLQSMTSGTPTVARTVLPLPHSRPPSRERALFQSIDARSYNVVNSGRDQDRSQEGITNAQSLGVNASFPHGEHLSSIQDGMDGLRYERSFEINALTVIDLQHLFLGATDRALDYSASQRAKREGEAISIPHHAQRQRISSNEQEQGLVRHQYGQAQAPQRSRASVSQDEVAPVHTPPPSACGQQSSSSPASFAVKHEAHQVEKSFPEEEELFGDVDDTLAANLIEQAEHQEEAQHQGQHMERAASMSQGEVGPRSSSVQRLCENDKKDIAQMMPPTSFIEMIKSHARQMENLTQIQEGLFKMQQEFSNQVQAFVAQCE